MGNVCSGLSKGKEEKPQTVTLQAYNEIRWAAKVLCSLIGVLGGGVADEVHGLRRFPLAFCCQSISIYFVPHRFLISSLTESYRLRLPRVSSQLLLCPIVSAQLAILVMGDFRRRSPMIRTRIDCPSFNKDWMFDRWENYWLFDS